MRILTALGALSLLLFFAGVIFEIWPHRSQVIADVLSVFTSSSTAPVAPGATASIPVAAPASTHPIDSLPVVPGGASPRLVVAGAMPKPDVAAETSPLAALGEVIPESETGPSAITDASGDHQGHLTQVPFMADARGHGGFGFGGADSASGGPAALDSPMWVPGGGGGGTSPDKGAGAGANGTSLVAPLGGNERNNNNVGAPNDGGPNGGSPNGGSPNGGSPNGGHPNGGDPNGGDPNGGDPNGGDPNGGGDEKTPPFGGYPPDTTGESPTTTTGNLIIDTTGGGGDDDGEVPSVPEPGTLTLLALGGCGLAARAARKRRG